MQTPRELGAYCCPHLEVGHDSKKEGLPRQYSGEGGVKPIPRKY